MYVGVTHETAPVEERTLFALNQEQKDKLIQRLKLKLHLRSVVVITTCNRTEIYFESSFCSAYTVREELVSYVSAINNGCEISRDVICVHNHSIDTVNHLLHVANGLRSAVVGDKQIINQVKGAYLQALEQNNQGSLLERAFQAVFRSHKRIQSESHYQRGSTSTAYSALKTIEEDFGKGQVKNLKLLIVGAGEIAEDILTYLPKFQFGETYIANRTHEKAARLAKHHDIAVYDWHYVEANDFTDFDVIITAVSNRRHLVKKVESNGKRRLWIDLAMPSNIDASMADAFNCIYNIDEITSRVEATNLRQLEAIPVVEQIIKEELGIFMDWLKKDDLRVFLKSYKARAKQAFLNTLLRESKRSLSVRELENHAETLANKLVRKSVNGQHAVVKNSDVLTCS